MATNHFKHVVFDTNALWVDNFESTWTGCCSWGELGLNIPEIVKLERLRQLTETALEAANKVKSGSGHLKKFCGFIPPVVPDDDDIRGRVKAYFNGWLSEQRAIIIPIRYERLPLPTMVHGAVWKIPPFEAKKEKGFRDFIVLEAVKELCATTDNDKVAFLCEDKLLRKTALGCIDNNRFASFEDLVAFDAQLRLDNASLDDNFKTAIVAIAPHAFYSRTEECAFVKCNVLQEIERRDGEILERYPHEAHRLYLMQENLGRGNPPLLDYSAGSLYHYCPTSAEFPIPRDTWFDKSENGRFYWKSVLELVRSFATDRGHRFDLLADMVRIATYEIMWSCKVDNDYRFTDYKREGIMAQPIIVQPLMMPYPTGLCVNKTWQQAESMG
jgi:hypothetical protein